MHRTLLLLLILAATPSAAADPPTQSQPASNLPPEQQLKAVEKKIDETKKSGADADRAALEAADGLGKLQDESVAAARAAQDNEAQLTELEARVAALSEQESRQAAELQTRQEHERQVLAALQRLAKNPPAAVLMSPGQPLDLARGAMLLGSVVPRLEAETRDIATALDALRRIRTDITAQQEQMADRQSALNAEHQRLADLMQQKQALAGEAHDRAKDAQEKLAALTAQAGDIKDLMQRVEKDREHKLDDDRRLAAEAKAKADKEEADRAAKAAARDIPSPGTQVATAAAAPAAAHDLAPPGRKLRELQPGKTVLQMPATGEISKHFGDPEGSSTSKGLSISTRAGAQVVAPFDGQVMFAGPFKGYGQILIIDHGGGYHSLLAGLEALQANVGQSVIAGEPVGTMRTEGAPSLYLELRRQGQPINPLPWLAARDGKVSG